MSKRLFIGNLPYDATDQQLRDLFSQEGEILEVNLITDKFTGRSKGFAFVEMKNDEEAVKAVEKLNGYEMAGRKIVVNEARPREERSFGSDRPSFGPRRDFGHDRRSGGSRGRY